jgi:ABC-2 type transport system ATP-binding protein
MIRTEGLTKEFDGLTAVDGLDLAVAEGEIFGFLGPNGAGKTTTMRMLSALIAPSSGRGWIDGLEIGRDDMTIRSRVGILTESPGLYDRLTARRNLEFYAALYGVRDVDGQVEKYLRLLDLWDRRDSAAGTFSKGMKQKLAIARALIHEPRLVFLDEPTSALDPESAKTVRGFIAGLRGQGRTIFLCTHNLEEAERLCDRVGVFRRRLIAVDTPEALRSRLFGSQVEIELAASAERYLDVVREMPFVRRSSAEGRTLVMTLEDPSAQRPVVVRALVSRGASIEGVREVEHSMEDVYLNLIHAEERVQEGAVS